MFLIVNFQMFEEAGMERIMSKRDLMTGYLELLLKKKVGEQMRIITPSDVEQRGAQLSLVFNLDLFRVHEYIERRGVVVGFTFVIYPIQDDD